MAAIPPEQVVTLVLSIFCGVLGVFLLTHKGVRMMKGGLLYRISVGLAAIGIVLSLNAGTKLFGLRSEERRVGKECRSRRWRYRCKKKSSESGSERHT